MNISDPLFSSQWHFNLIGDVQRIWDDYTGNGVRVAVFDDGVERSHSDLDANYDSSGHYPGYFGTGLDDGLPNSSSDGHGTSVAGIIAAENNGQGGVGVSFDATITSVDFINDIQYETSTVLYDALRFASNFDIMNNSWGSTPSYSSRGDIGDTYGWGASTRSAFEHSVQTGRDGLGTIIVKAAGNEANDPTLAAAGILGNASGDGRNNLHSIITVAATDQNGNVTDYSNWGSSILVTAPAASVTTDLNGGGGYSGSDYTDAFGGTSAATPVISGVVALMLQANPNLGWRDVQNILALSASHTGSSLGIGANGFEVDSWMTTSTENWNGGGTSFHFNYGFGMVDAFAAVRFAEVWGVLNDSPATSSNEIIVNDTYTGAQLTISDNSTTEMSISVTEGVLIEHIYVNVDYSHSNLGDVTIELIAPNGEVFELFLRELGTTSSYGDWTFGVTGALGLSSIGDWTLRVTDSATGNTGTLRDFDIEFHGSALNGDTTYHFTDDFLSYAGQQSGRRSITDDDGGTDWINLSAITGNVSLNMASNGLLSVAGETWTTFSNGNEIEGATLGDGNDVVSGNAADNSLLGGRGNDRLFGNGGADDLQGGNGSDLIDGGSGGDLLDGGNGSDSLFGALGSDTLIGSAGDDLLNGEVSSASLDVALAQVYRLYQATLGRTPDPEGHQSWATILESGVQALESVVSGFVNSAEFQSVYGATSDSGFVTLLYANVLGRTPDAQGLTNWTTALSSGAMSREQVVLGFSESVEFQNNTQASSLQYSWSGYMDDWSDNVFRLYQATLDRLPDFAGPTNWSAALADGMAFASVISGFVNSVEFQIRYGATSNSEFVTLMYNNVLGRVPDAAGLASWTEALDSGALTREDIVRGFSESREFILASEDAFEAFIIAQGEDDRLEGGSGSNMLYGGWLSDTFVFNANHNAQTTVADLESWDHIELSNFGFANGTAAISALVQVGDDVRLSGGGTTITFADTQISDFTADMFILV